MNPRLLAAPVLAGSAAAFALGGPAARPGSALFSIVPNAPLTLAQVDFFAVNGTAAAPAPPPPVATPAAAAGTPSAATELLAVLAGNEERADVVSLIEACESSYDPDAFDESDLLGDWRLAYQHDSKDATRSQRALAGRPAESNFVTDEKGRRVFRNVARVSERRVAVVADVAYELWGANRLKSDIVAAGLTVRIGERFGRREPFRVPLPLRGTGWLDVTYLDEAMRITRGNRGGLFVHVRPELA